MNDQAYLKYLTIFLISTLLIFGCSSDKKKTDQFLSEGKAYIEKQEFKKAVIQLKNAIKIDSKSIEANKLLVQAYLKLGNPEELFKAYLRLEQLEPENLDTKLKVATIYLLGNKTTEATSRMDLVLSKEPENIDALFLHAGILGQKKEDISSIEQVYDKIINIDPAQTKAHMMLSKIYFSQKQFKKVEESIKTTLKLTPDDINIHKSLVDFYISQKDI
ncbi:MAG: hypothetical protein GY699_10150, partial [Desulfobacteraceae bacterium]|nr:hypothetical protein [Desulfobacteraceae bacterium]